MRSLCLMNAGREAEIVLAEDKKDRKSLLKITTIGRDSSK